MRVLYAGYYVLCSLGEEEINLRAERIPGGPRLAESSSASGSVASVLPVGSFSVYGVQRYHSEYEQCNPPQVEKNRAVAWNDQNASCFLNRRY